MSGITSQALYFGKLPSRGDFVRSSAGSALIRTIDQWMSQTMDLLTQDTRWKIVYDAAAPVHFAIIGSQSHAGLVGHLAVSKDASGRRFPFVMAASFEVPQPLGFIPYCPQALTPLWARLDAGVRQAMGAEDFSMVQEHLVAQPVELEVRMEPLRDAYKAFAQQMTIGTLEAAIALPESAFSFRRTILALGLLLQPILTQGHTGLSKGLVLPLPPTLRQITSVTTMWVELVTRFFKRTPAEIAVFVTTHRQEPVLVMGFRGASASTLHSVLDAEICQSENVVVSNAEWVEDWIDTDYGLRRLSNYLRDPSLSIAAAADMFRETFLGN